MAKPACLLQLQEIIKKESPKVRKQLKPYYGEYISKISTDEMAISLKLCIFLHLICKLLKPKRILDLGSGLSTFVFHYYKKNEDNTAQVYSVDDNPQWLKKTQYFVNKHGLKTNRLYSWNTFRKRSHPKFDLIFNDLGSWKIRGKKLRYILGLIKKKGIVILDDFQKRSYSSYAKQTLKSLNFAYYNLKRYTKDKFDRYSFLAIPQNDK